jgi:hypothetical protein
VLFPDIWTLPRFQRTYSLRFQVLTAASMMFRVVFWDILPCKMIVDKARRNPPPKDSWYIWPVVISRSHWYHPGLSTRPFQGLNCIHLTSSPDIPLSLLLEPTTHCHWPVPSLSSLSKTGHLGTGLLYKPDPFVLGSLIPDDGGSTHLWNVGRQSFYTAVYPRRQPWTSYSPPWELEISHS